MQVRFLYHRAAHTGSPLARKRQSKARGRVKDEFVSRRIATIHAVGALAPVRDVAGGNDDFGGAAAWLHALYDVDAAGRGRL